VPPSGLASGPPGEKAPPVPFKTQIKIRGAIGRPQYVEDHLVPCAQTDRGLDLPKAASVSGLDGRHSAEQLGGRNRGIVVGKPIAARDELRIILGARAGHHPVRKQTPLARVQYDLPLRNFRQAGALDRNQITWKDGRHHARAEYAEANFSEGADYVARQTTRLRRHVLGSVHKPSKQQATRLSCCYGSHPG
jgi:hypothetical protein